ncbi:MAG: hypothetical protein P4L40_07275 [Terracidiphilus sp.]|nr:hypothetical protein [Terracidiphilus sp.]
MEPQNAMEANLAWKLAFAPYAASPDGSFTAVTNDTKQPVPRQASLRIIALPVVATICDSRHRLHTRATAVLIRSDAGPSAGSAPGIAVKPLPASASCAAIRSITPLKGRFTA